MQVRIDIGSNGRIIHREVVHGRFLAPDEATPSV
jgi:hypothetical protein